MIAVRKDNRDIILVGVSPETVVNPTDYDWYEEPEFSDLPETGLTWDTLQSILMQDLIKAKETELAQETMSLLGSEEISHSVIIRLALLALYLVSKLASDIQNSGISTTSYDAAVISDLETITATLIEKDYKPGPGTISLLNEISAKVDEFLAFVNDLQTNGLPTLNQQLFGEE